MNSDVKPLHLHTLDSLCIELIAGNAISVGNDNNEFSLQSVYAQSVLQWYYKNRQKWNGNVSVNDVNSIVDSIEIAPEITSIPSSNVSSNKKIYTLVKLQARQFAGLHFPTLSSNLADDFIYEFKHPITLFEGWNGSGKTSILNAVIWALTGEILRPQRLPESAVNDFDCEIQSEIGDEITKHAISPITPLPDLSIARPTTNVPAASWVELTFKDEEDNLFSLSRAQSRTSRGKLEETKSGFEAFNLDPVAFRMGTVMPGMLPFIQIGTESKFGKAVAELTGMAPLVNLASHAERSRKKIDGDLTKERNAKIGELDLTYKRSLNDFEQILSDNAYFSPPNQVPEPSTDKNIENELDKLSTYFEGLKATSLQDAENVLGNDFDATDVSSRQDLEKNITPALSLVGELSQLPSVSRLASLKGLTDGEITSVEENINQIIADAKELILLASNPSKAGRIRLYSFINAWSKDHPDLAVNNNTCLLCTHDIGEAIDPITGLKVSQHLHEAGKADSQFLSYTLLNWAEVTLGKLIKDLPSVLQSELKKELPQHPGHLVVRALTEELFNTSAFKGVLQKLKGSTTQTCEMINNQCPPLGAPLFPDFTNGLSELQNLSACITIVDRAIRFSQWRTLHNNIILEFMSKGVGQKNSNGVEPDINSLLGKLLRLQEIVNGVDPINQALLFISRMLEDIKKRRLEESRLDSYLLASKALQECMKVGELAEDQVKDLQSLLQESAVAWRKLIYQGAFPTTERHLKSTRMSSDGHLEFLIGTEGVSAPAQHVANASALRASLVGFFFAYWSHLLKERGGLRILLLDDPQELLDGDNRERLAESLPEVIKANGQLVVTTHDIKFAQLINRSFQSSVFTGDFQYIHPATKIRQTLFSSPSMEKVQVCYTKYLADTDNSEASQNYASECRLFIEGRLGDLFDDTAFPNSTTIKFKPTLMDHLGRLRGLIKNTSNELYKSKILLKFCNDPALADNAPTLALLNKAHHAKNTIQPNEVFKAKEDLERLRSLVESVHQEFRLFCRRAPLQHIPYVNKAKAIERSNIPNFSVLVQPNLAAFVRGASSGDSQETQLNELSSTWFEDKAFFLLRAGNFGFSGPATSVAIVEAIPSVVEDRSLVIARQNNKVLARRLLRPKDKTLIALTAETPDPRRSPPTILSNETDYSLHKVVGILFERVINPPSSEYEAVMVDGASLLKSIKSAYEIKEDSAIPLALPGQIALGSSSINLDELDRYIDAYVALHLADGSSIFKRVGQSLPKPLNHLRNFETIGGLGVAEILAVNQEQAGFRTLLHAVLIIGVLYHG